MMHDGTKRIVYNKLVRDKIPEIIETSGKMCTCETLPEDKYIVNLNIKLLEEVNEYLESGTVEELADICEVMHAILAFMNIPLAALESVRLEKHKERGGFEKRLLLKEVIER